MRELAVRCSLSSTTFPVPQLSSALVVVRYVEQNRDDVCLFIAAIRSDTRVYRFSEARTWIRAAVVVYPVDRSCEV
jgi:hypothetical protein